jgi:predicted DNA-binding transcriptional regulator AlpA
VQATLPEIKIVAGDRLLDEHQAADRLGVSVKKLQACRAKDDLVYPPFIKLGRLVRYRQSDIDHCIANRPSYRKHHIALLNDDLDSGVIEEKDEVNASLHRIGAMRRSIKEMK